MRDIIDYPLTRLVCAWSQNTAAEPILHHNVTICGELKEKPNSGDDLYNDDVT